MKKEAIIILGIMFLYIGVFLVSAVVPTDNDSDSFNSTIDCDDNNSSIWQNTSLYLDNDVDSFGAGNAIVKCIGSSIPPGFSNVSSDCDNNNSSLWTNQNLFLDNDLDSFGAGTSILKCIGNTIPLGYSNVSSDCDDSNLSIWNPIIGYQDRDNDNFGDNIPINFCQSNIPNNHVSLNGDCEDTNPFIFPNATETCNGIDDNCNGIIDELYPTKGQICYVGIGECRNSGIMICNTNQNDTFCKGQAKKPSKEICDSKDNDCDSLTDEDGICDIINTTLKIFMPESKIFNTNKIKVNMTILSSQGIIVDKISYIDNSATKIKETQLCRKCSDYGFYSNRFLNLKDGMHNLTFKALFNESTLTEDVTIFIDSKKPKIKLPTIRTKMFINGTFNVNYEEDNVKNITLFYDNKSTNFENCSSGKDQICNQYINLLEYNGDNIVYYYKINDISDNIAISKNISAEVDLTSPVIENMTYPIIGNYVFFKLNVTEKNFKDISYYDYSDDNPKWRVLCSALNNGICEKEQRFSPGEHNITIRVLDKAGNSAFINDI